MTGWNAVRMRCSWLCFWRAHAWHQARMVERAAGACGRVAPRARADAWRQGRVRTRARAVRSIRCMDAGCGYSEGWCCRCGRTSRAWRPPQTSRSMTPSLTRQRRAGWLGMARPMAQAWLCAMVQGRGWSMGCGLVRPILCLVPLLSGGLRTLCGHFVLVVHQDHAWWRWTRSLRHQHSSAPLDSPAV